MLTAKVILLVVIAIVLFGLVASWIFIFYETRLKYGSGFKHYNRGVEKGKQGDCRGAIEDFTQALRYNPKLIEAYIERGICRYREGDRQGGIEDFTKAVKINYTKANTYFDQAKIRTNLGEVSGAIADYQQVAKLFFEQKDTDNYRVAIAKLKQMRSSRPQPTASSNDLMAKGLHQAKIGNHKGAIEEFDKALQLNSQDSQIYYNRGLARFELGDEKGAIADFTQALTFDSNCADAYFSRGNAYQKQGFYEESIQDYTHFLELKPNDALAYYSRAIAYAELADKRRSLEDKRKAREDYQKAADLFFEKGDMLYYQRSLKKMPLPETPSQQVTDKEASSSKSAAFNSKGKSDRSQENPNAHLNNSDLQSKLIRLLQGNRAAADRLLSQAKNKYPGKSVNWYFEKVIEDLERDSR